VSEQVLAADTKDLICGVDTGGTFTDSVIIGGGRMVTGKAPSTPDDFAAGVFASLGRSGAQMDLDLGAILARTGRLVVGTTVGTNAFLERKGAKVGLITTRGFADTLHIMRGVGRSTGVAPHETMALERSFKPAPLIPKALAREIRERVDSDGELLLEADAQEIVAAARELVEAGCDAISVCFLWSFKNPRNEQLAREAITNAFPDVYLSCSHEVAPKIGEYERFAATTINAFIGPVTLRYVDSIRARCEQEGYMLPPLIMQCNGGVMSGELVQRHAIVTLNSGPAGGVTGSSQLAQAMGISDVITADAGGTSFDVGLIRDGEVVQSDKTEIGHFEFYIPTIDVRTIGAGGGSVARRDDTRGVISVGPESAGADPGPICYGRGGDRPTLTDAALVLGYLSSVTSLDRDRNGGDGQRNGDGRATLERDAALDGIGRLGADLGLSAREAAIGIVRIAESRMADLIRRAVVSGGFDPRDFTVFAYGGAGPIHAAGFARELAVRQIIIPMGNTASVWSAYGVATSDIKHVHEYASVFGEPFDLQGIADVFADLGSRVDGSLRQERVDAAAVRRRYELGIRYKSQLNEVYVDLDTPSPDEAAMGETITRFERKYAQIFGEEAGFREAGIEVVDFRVTAVGGADQVALAAVETSGRIEDAVRGQRQVLFVDAGEDGYVDATVYDGVAIPVGERLAGPALIELAGTTVVVPPDYRARRDRRGNFILTHVDREDHNA
jgi:N-methylhydantoinase A